MDKYLSARIDFYTFSPQQKIESRTIFNAENDKGLRTFFFLDYFDHNNVDNYYLKIMDKIQLGLRVQLIKH
jgi:hypothetical protein